MSVIEKLPGIRDVFAEIKDPLFKKEAKSLLDAMDLATRFKRIDMSFLQMPNENRIPKFAILPYDLYKQSATCNWTGKNFQWIDDKGLTVHAFAELFPASVTTASAMANPTKSVPETIAAQVEDARPNFDEVFVAWEAEWNVSQKDPIVIGRKGKFFFIVATWDLSKLESYVCQEFV